MQTTGPGKGIGQSGDTGKLHGLHLAEGSGPPGSKAWAAEMTVSWHTVLFDSFTMSKRRRDGALQGHGQRKRILLPG